MREKTAWLQYIGAFVKLITESRHLSKLNLWRYRRKRQNVLALMVAVKNHRPHHSDIICPTKALEETLQLDFSARSS
jgi:hypothetical protein